MAAFPHLFSPVRYGRREARNRLVQAPMSVGYADREGRATRAMVEHYGRRAKGGVGMVITENVAVNRSGRQMLLQPMLADDGAVESFAAVAAEIRGHGALAVMQIVHAGRYAGPWDVYDADRRLAPSAVGFPLPIGRDVTPVEITAEEIEETLEAFAATAARAEAAGFDGVELHAAQGFLISQFLSPRTNRRTDRWGGGFDARVSFLLEAVRRVRGRVGAGFMLGVHLISDELVPDGWTLDDAVALAVRLDPADIDFLMPVVSTFETMRMPSNAGLMDRASFQHREAHAIKRACGVAVVTNGGIHDPDLAEQVLVDGEADAVGLARPLFTDPDWAAKVGAGRFADVLRCPCSPPTCLRTQLTGSVCERWPEAAKTAGYLGYQI